MPQKYLQDICKASERQKSLSGPTHPQEERYATAASLGGLSDIQLGRGAETHTRTQQGDRQYLGHIYQACDEEVIDSQVRDPIKAGEGVTGHNVGGVDLKQSSNMKKW